MPPIEWLIDKVFPVKSFGVIYGMPGKGKTFAALDMALCVANGIDWHEREVKQGNVLYIAGEGVGGLSKRIGVWFQHHAINPNDADFYVLPLAVNLMDETETEKLLSSIKHADKQFSMVVIDTVARSMLGKDENSSTDMGLFVKACDAIKEATKATVIGIHHSGKDEDRGMRGSSSLLGAVDTVLKISQEEKIITLSMEKQKDEEAIEPMNFNMRVLEFGIGQSSVVLEYTTENVPMKVNKFEKTKRHDLALEYLQDCIARSSDKMYGQPATQLNQWKLECASREFGGMTLDSKRKAFERAFKKLTETKQIACKSGLVWILS